jgi:ribosomal protein S18 acetylase RimI-like enzyme
LYIEEPITQRKANLCQLVTFGLMDPVSIRPEVIEIADENFISAWKEKEFLEALDGPRKGCLLAKTGTQIAGFLVYSLVNWDLEIKYMAVGVNFQRKYIGTQLINFLKTKLLHERIQKLTLLVEETDEIATLFLRTLEFKAKLKKNAFRDRLRDGYVFSFTN